MKKMTKTEKKDLIWRLNRTELMVKFYEMIREYAAYHKLSPREVRRTIGMKLLED